MPPRGRFPWVARSLRCCMPMVPLPISRMSPIGQRFSRWSPGTPGRVLEGITVRQAAGLMTGRAGISPSSSLGHQSPGSIQ